MCNTLWPWVKWMPVNFHSNIHIRVIAIFCKSSEVVRAHYIPPPLVFLAFNNILENILFNSAYFVHEYAQLSICKRIYEDNNQIGIQSEHMEGFSFNYITKWIQINLFHISKSFETIN